MLIPKNIQVFGQQSQMQLIIRQPLRKWRRQDRQLMEWTISNATIKVVESATIE